MALPIHVPRGVLTMICSARARAASITSPSGTVSRTSPILAASSPSTRRPVSTSSAARAAPTMRWRSQLSPISAPDVPILTNVSTTLRMPQPPAGRHPTPACSPAPAAGPLTAANTGWGSARIRGTSSATYFCWYMLECIGPTSVGTHAGVVVTEVVPGTEPPTCPRDHDHSTRGRSCPPSPSRTS